MSRSRKAHPRHQHIMGKPWTTASGHMLATCTVEGCSYTEQDGRNASSSGTTAPAVQQGALFDVWGAGIVPDAH